MRLETNRGDAAMPKRDHEDQKDAHNCPWKRRARPATSFRHVHEEESANHVSKPSIPLPYWWYGKEAFGFSFSFSLASFCILDTISSISKETVSSKAGADGICNSVCDSVSVALLLHFIRGHYQFSFVALDIDLPNMSNGNQGVPRSSSGEIIHTLTITLGLGQPT